MMNNIDEDETDGEDNVEEKYIKEIQYRGYTLFVEYNSEGTFRDNENFENDVLKRALRFIGGTAYYADMPIYAGAEMFGAVLSDVFVKEGYEVADRIKGTQNKLYKIDFKVDSTVLSRCSAMIKYALNCLKEFLLYNDISDFKEFYEKSFQSISELASFLSENKPIPSLMNSVTTLTKIVEEGVNSIKVNSVHKNKPRKLEFKYKSIVQLIEDSKIVLSSQWIKCMKYYNKNVKYGKEEIKKFFGSYTEYYAEDKLHDIVIKINYRTRWFGGPKEKPREVLKKYMESIHCHQLIRECSLTYEYIKHLIDQDIYPEEKYCVSVDPIESNEINKLVFTIKMYQDSGYAKDTLPLILKIFDLKFDDLSKDLKSFIKVCFEKYAEDDEYSSEVIDGELKKCQNKSYLEDLEAYQALVNNQLVLKYQQIIDIVHKILVPRAKKIESQLKPVVIGCEFKARICNIICDSKLNKEIKEATALHDAANELSLTISNSSPVKLKFIYIFSNFLFEVIENVYMAKKIVKETLKTAQDDLDDLNIKDKQKSIAYIEKLEDNLVKFRCKRK